MPKGDIIDRIKDGGSEAYTDKPARRAWGQSGAGIRVLKPTSQSPTFKGHAGHCRVDMEISETPLAQRAFDALGFQGIASLRRSSATCTRLFVEGTP